MEDSLYSPWDDNPVLANTDVRDAEWTKISFDFTNAGYREGITAGKESAFQSGFDTGFADTGAPFGRQLGLLRGTSSAILSFLISAPQNAQDDDAMIIEARDIASQLSEVRFSDIAPCDLEAEEHARQHLESDSEDMGINQELVEKRQMEGLEDLLADLTAGTSGGGGRGQNCSGRLTMDDVRRLGERLEVLCRKIGLDMNWT